jgi:hypothetical protein
MTLVEAVTLAFNSARRFGPRYSWPLVLQHARGRPVASLSDVLFDRAAYGIPRPASAIGASATASAMAVKRTVTIRALIVCSCR